MSTDQPEAETAHRLLAFVKWRICGENCTFASTMCSYNHLKTRQLPEPVLNTSAILSITHGDVGWLFFFKEILK